MFGLFSKGPKLKLGDRIRVTAGPFTGFSGVVTALPSGRVRALLTVSDKQVDAEMSRSEVEAA